MVGTLAQGPTRTACLLGQERGTSLALHGPPSPGATTCPWLPWHLRLSDCCSGSHGTLTCVGQPGGPGHLCPGGRPHLCGRGGQANAQLPSPGTTSRPWPHSARGQGALLDVSQQPRRVHSALHRFLAHAAPEPWCPCLGMRWHWESTWSAGCQSAPELLEGAVRGGGEHSLEEGAQGPPGHSPLPWQPGWRSRS